MYTKAQATEEKPTNPNEGRAEQLATQIDASSRNINTTVSTIIQLIGLLNADPEYGPSNQAKLSSLKNKYLALQQSLEGSVGAFASLNSFIKTAQKVIKPSAPSSDFENASALYEKLGALEAQLGGQLATHLRYMDEARGITDRSISTGEDWAKEIATEKENWKNSRTLAWDLDLTQKRAKTLRKAYPAMQPMTSELEKIDLDKWQKIAINIQSFSRVYRKEYTFAQVLYHFTKDWDMFERYDFKKWFKWTQKTAGDKMKFEKYAADQINTDRIQQFSDKRKKLLNRINLVRKALHELINSGLIQQQDSNKLYKVIAMLEFEAMRIESPKLAAARIRRTAGICGKLGFVEGQQELITAAKEFLSNSKSSLIKVAADDQEEKKNKSQEAIEILKEIKKEMDSLNYSRHLDTLYSIKKKLELMGRSGDMESVEKIIRDDLATLEKLNKKLIEVYTNLSKVPLELSTLQDQQIQKTPGKQSINVPLEVTEEDTETKVAPKATTPKVTPRPMQPASKPVARQLPALEKGIPNV